MRDKDLLKLLLKNGWQDVRQRGSHHRLIKDDKVEVIAVHNVILKKDRAEIKPFPPRYKLNWRDNHDFYLSGDYS